MRSKLKSLPPGGAAGPLVRRFRKRFGSLECREITGRSFDGVSDLADYMSESRVCAEIKDWCRSEVSEAINKWV